MSGLTVARPMLKDLDPTRDKTYQQARSARAVTDWLAWLDLGGKAARTLDQYERDLSRLCLMFPSKDVDEITDGDLVQVLATFPPKGRPKRAAAYSGFFRWLYQGRKISANPMALMPTMKVTPQQYLETFKDAEMAALCGLDGIDGTLMQLLFDTGIRKGEARHLRVKDTQLDAGRVIVLKGKGSRDRVIPMTATLQSELAERVLVDGLNEMDYWWYSVKANALSRKVNRSEPVGEGTFHRWWAGCLERADVRYLKPHTTRHSFATAWFKKGLTPQAIQILLGHSSIKTTMDLYVHTSVEDIAVQMAELLR